MIDASKSLVDDGVHLLSHTAEIVGAVMVVGGGVLVVVRSMLKGLDRRTKSHIDAATRPLIPNGGESIGDLPGAIKNLASQNQSEHCEIREDLTGMAAKNDAEHDRIYDKLQDHRASTDDKIDALQEHQQTLLERLLFRHPNEEES